MFNESKNYFHECNRDSVVGHPRTTFFSGLLNFIYRISHFTNIFHRVTVKK